MDIQSQIADLEAEHTRNHNFCVHNHWLSIGYLTKLSNRNEVIDELLEELNTQLWLTEELEG